MTGLACEEPVALWRGRKAKLKNLQLQQDCVWEAPLTAPDWGIQQEGLSPPSLTELQLQLRNGPRA